MTPSNFNSQCHGHILALSSGAEQDCLSVCSPFSRNEREMSATHSEMFRVGTSLFGWEFWEI